MEKISWPKNIIFSCNQLQTRKRKIDVPLPCFWRSLRGEAPASPRYTRSGRLETWSQNPWGEKREVPIFVHRLPCTSTAAALRNVNLTDQIFRKVWLPNTLAHPNVQGKQFPTDLDPDLEIQCATFKKFLILFDFELLFFSLEKDYKIWKWLFFMIFSHTFIFYTKLQGNFNI